MAIEALMDLGRHEEAQDHFEQFQSLFAQEEQMPLPWAAAFFALGEQDQAMLVLRRSLEHGDPTLAWIGQLPELDRLRDHPEFREIVAAVGVPNPRLGN